MSLARVQGFLLAEEIETPSRDNREKIGISISNGEFQWKVCVVRVIHVQSLPPQVSPEMNCCCVSPPKQDVQSDAAVDPNEQSLPFELTSINASFESGQLSAIVGHVGCGKSSLLSAILGEMPRVDSFVDLNRVVRIKGSIAYVPQTPFIMNASLRDNILFGAPFDAEKYQVLFPCPCDA